MRGEEVRFLAEIFLRGFVFVMVVTAVAVFLFGRDPVPSDEITGKISTPGTIDVWLTEKKKVVTVDFEAYVCRVTAGEMPASLNRKR